MKCDWRRAVENFEVFLKDNEAPSFRAYCGYQLGISYIMLGDNENARRILEKVPRWVRKGYTFDQFAARKAKEYLTHGITQFEKQLVVAFIKAKESPQEALQLLEEADRLDEQQKSSELKGVYWYQRGVVLKLLNKKQEAKDALLKCISMAPQLKNEIYVVPHAYVEYGDILLEENELQGAKDAYLTARKKFKDYDFDKPLIRRIERNLDIIAHQISNDHNSS
jgi:tetratricopeptide (TPR) repeat protein